MLSVENHINESLNIFIPNSIKVALGISNWALGSYCLAVTQAKHCIVFVCPSTQGPIANDQLPKQLLLN